MKRSYHGCDTSPGGLQDRYPSTGFSSAPNSPRPGWRGLSFREHSRSRRREVRLRVEPTLIEAEIPHDLKCLQDRQPIFLIVVHFGLTPAKGRGTRAD